MEGEVGQGGEGSEGREERKVNRGEERERRGREKGVVREGTFIHMPWHCLHSVRATKCIATYSSSSTPTQQTSNREYILAVESVEQVRKTFR